MKNKGKKEVVKLPQAKLEEEVITVAEKFNKADALLNPIATACTTIRASRHKNPNVDTDYLQQILRLKSKAIIDGDMKAVEELLITQSYVLNNVFCDTLAMVNVAGTPHPEPMRKIIECYAKIGLKAQAQCRATLETLANIKNPPQLAFVRQQNIAYQQQVNNKESAIAKEPLNSVEVNDSKPRARRKTKFLKNELLESKNNVTRLEPRKAKKAVRTHKKMETLE